MARKPKVKAKAHDDDNDAYTPDHESALFQQVVKDPEDDASRLVYADLLQHRGDPRGELIAVQCALAGLGWNSSLPSLAAWAANASIDRDVCESPEMRKLRLREAALLKAHANQWSEEVVGIGRCYPAAIRFARGFIDHVEWALRSAEGGSARSRGNAADAVTASITKLFELAPLATSLGLNRNSSSTPITWEDAARFFACRPLEKLQSFSVAGVLGGVPDGIALLVACRRFKSLKRLDGQLQGSVTQEMRQLSRASFFDELEWLDLSTSGFGEAMTPTLPPSLSTLQLRSCGLGPSGGATIARSSLSNLRVLGLRDNGLLSDGVNALAKSESLKGLRALDLRKNGLTTKNAEKLLASNDAFPELRVLDLSKISRGAWDRRTLETLDGMPSLFELHLEAANFDDDAAEALVRSPLLSRLRVLDLRDNMLDDRGVRALASADACKNLRLLVLTGNMFGADGKKALAESWNLGNTRVVTSPITERTERNPT